MEQFEQRKFSVTPEEKEQLSPEKLAELEDKVRKANALAGETEKEEITEETTKGVEKLLEEEE